MDIDDAREACGEWDYELGCALDDAEQQCPYYKECSE